MVHKVKTRQFTTMMETLRSEPIEQRDEQVQRD